MNDKTYLRWYNKIGYGSGDIAGNVVYAFLSSFVMIYLSDTVGLSTGIVGTLIMFSKLFDGVTDIFFGSMIDKTKSKMGKARPWMFWAYFGCAAMIIAIFAIPANMSEVSKYAWFFIAYTALNAVFYTANNIAYSALTALITRNGNERVQIGAIRFIFAFGTSLFIQTITVDAVRMLGGGATGWRTVATIYAVIGLVVNSLSVFSVKELPLEELYREDSEKEEDYSLKEVAQILVKNKYYLMICVTYILMQIYSATIGMGIYFMKYILGDEGLLGTFALAINIPLICGLIATPVLVKKLGGMYRINLLGYLLGTIARGLVLVAGYMGSIPLMLLFSAVASIGMSPLQGDMNALIAEASDYTFYTQKKRIDGTMYSCTSLGVKIGGGIGTAMAGWLLEISGFVANATEQTASCIQMLHVMYLWIPMIINLFITLILFRLKVEQTNADVRKEM